MTSEGYALELRGITKRFGATVALNEASLVVRAGTVHLLLGENGAGKTTLLKVAAGLAVPDAGEILVRGRIVRWRSRAEALSAGLSIVQQQFSLVPAMTVAENVALAEGRLARRYSPQTAHETVRRLAEFSGLRVDPGTIVGDLPVAAQQRVEIIKAIAHDAPVLVLDEPTAVLSPLEAREMFRWLRSFVGRGHTVVVITHRLREAMEHGDDFTVLRGGRTALTATRGFVDEQTVLSAILGEPNGGASAYQSSEPTGRSGSHGAPILALGKVSVVNAAGTLRLGPTSVTMHAGELVGVAGVDGAGQHELLQLLAGRLQPSHGTVTIPGTVGFVPEDRLRDAIVPEFSLAENVALRGASIRTGVVDWDGIRAGTNAIMQTFDVRAADAGAVADGLSGGNQQKFVLARELADSPPAIVAENPTRGLDIRAARDILDRLRAARNAGAAVVVYSSDVDELLSIADRVIVCYAGTVRELPLDAGIIGRAMVGAG